MKNGSGWVALDAAGTVLVCLLSLVLVGSQAQPPQSTQTTPEKSLMAEQYFKNVQLLRGIPVDEFMGTMGFIAAATGMNCTQCHVEESGSDWARYADDTPLKQTARKMIIMVNLINRSNFGGRREVTCYSCHRGGTRPKVVPDLTEQYAVPPPVDPEEILEQIPGAPSVDQIFDKYVLALGGAQRLAGVT
jgi:photosynthetic reaction center cytochrome c subunit